MIHQKTLRNVFIFLGIIFSGLVYVVGQTAAPGKIDHWKALVPENYLLSTQVYCQLANHYYDKLVDQLQPLCTAIPKWNFSSSPYFMSNTDKSLEYDFLASMANMDVLESNIKEAFWYGSPNLSVLFIRWLENLRNHVPQALSAKPIAKGIKLDVVPFDVEMEFTYGGKTTLGQLSSGKKAILLDFWAPWCGPCMSLMPSLVKKAEILESQGIVVAAAATDDRGKAEKIRRDKAIKFPWLMENDSQFYSKLFDIQSIPRMVLISQDGEVLFNGHPQDEGLRKSLSYLGITL